MKIVVATKNEGKLKEIKEILNSDSFDVVSQVLLGIDMDVEETGSTFEENALLKACAVAKVSGEITIADDSGLMCDFLNGEPGIFSARYASSDHPDDQKNNDKLLDKLSGAKTCERGAKFVSAVACVFPGGERFVVRGECAGEITRKRRGAGGFGYDPIFFYPPLKKTFGEMDEREKNSISHRKIALVKFQKAFNLFLKIAGE